MHSDHACENFHRGTWDRLMQRGNALLIAGLAAVAAVFYLLDRAYWIDGYGYGFFATSFGYSLVAAAFAVVLLSAVSPNSVLYRIRIPGAAQLAAWSYAIYLSHKPIAMIVQGQLGKAGWSPWVLVPAVACACVFGAWLLYRLVETPFMKLRDRRFPTNFPGASGAVARPASAISPA